MAAVYREARAPELTEALWGHPGSPWFEQINMLGEPGRRQISQASFIRSLLASFIKRAAGRRVSIGGLFGSKTEGDPALPWTRAQRAAFLIFLGAVSMTLPETHQASVPSRRPCRRRSSVRLGLPSPVHGPRGPRGLAGHK